MGTIRKRSSVARNSGLAGALFTTTQQRVLGLLFGQPDRSFYASELIRLADAGSGAVQRELLRLEQGGLVNVAREATRKHYRANPDSPLYDELCSIARKTVGLAEPLREALAPIARRIRAAFVYGSVAKRTDKAASDIDLMVVSEDLDYPDVMEALRSATDTLGREVNPTIYNPRELARRLKEGNSFVQRVLAQPKLWVIGGEHELPA